jgi:hypothetical protein
VNLVNDKKELASSLVLDSEEKLTRQVKVSMPISYLRALDSIAKNLRMPKRFIYWSAVGNYIDVCRQSAKKGQRN